MEFLDTFSFLAQVVKTCNYFDSDDANNKFIAIIKIARTVVQIIQVVVPILLIIWGSLDMAKAVIEGDEKKMKEKRKPFIQRIISAVVVFLIPFLVSTILGLVGTQEWKNCWKKAGDKGNTSAIIDRTHNPIEPD